MEGFLNFIQPEVIFHQFRGEPDDNTYQSMQERARKLRVVAAVETEAFDRGRVVHRHMQQRLLADTRDERPMRPARMFRLLPPPAEAVQQFAMATEVQDER